MLLQTQSDAKTCGTGAGTLVKLKCTVTGCNRHYSRADSLRDHTRVANGENLAKKKARFTCPTVDCNKTYFHAIQLINHE